MAETDTVTVPVEVELHEDVMLGDTVTNVVREWVFDLWLFVLEVVVDGVLVPLTLREPIEELVALDDGVNVIDSSGVLETTLDDEAVAEHEADSVTVYDEVTDLE
jgi:hypothetical protein